MQTRPSYDTYQFLHLNTGKLERELRGPTCRLDAMPVAQPRSAFPHFHNLQTPPLRVFNSHFQVSFYSAWSFSSASSFSNAFSTRCHSTPAWASVKTISRSAATMNRTHLTRTELYEHTVVPASYLFFEACRVPSCALG